MNVVWCLPAMEHFGKVVSAATGWPLYVDAPIPDCDVCYIVGMYDVPYYGRTLAQTKRAKRRVIDWCGTDSKVIQVGMLPGNATYIAENDLYRDLVRAEGLDCETCPKPTKHHFPVTPLPETPTIGAYLGNNAESYGGAYIRMLQDAFPDVLFHTYSYNQYGADEMADIMATTTVQVQLGNDGGGHILREAMEAGRYAVTTLNLKHAIKVHNDDIPRIIREVGKALKHTEPDLVASEYWAAYNTDEAFVGRLHEQASL